MSVAQVGDIGIGGQGTDVISYANQAAVQHPGLIVFVLNWLLPRYQGKLGYAAYAAVDSGQGTIIVIGYTQAGPIDFPQSLPSVSEDVHVVPS